MSSPKMYLSSLGCPKNLVDAEVMTAELCSLGYETTDSPQEAELILLNTCAFILPAKEESIAEIFRLAQLKDPARGACRHLVVTGCLPQRYGDSLHKLLPEVDLFLGINEVARIGAHVRRLVSGEALPPRIVVSEPTFIMGSQAPRVLATPGHSAYLKIAEGCSNRCSYCVIPQIRGAARSRSIDDLIREAETLAAAGVKELIVIAQDTTAYGKDLPGKPTLDELLRQLVALDGISWIRILYAYPGGIDGKILKTIAREDKICKYLDLPIQHSDDRILDAMNRRGGQQTIVSTINEIRKAIPDIALRTSLIVGFPGESPKQFRGLLDFVKAVRFDHLGVFVYSREEGTPAAKLPRQVSQKVKEERRQIIMEEQAIISYQVNQGLIGSRQWVMVEGKSDRQDYSHIGRASRQAPEIDGVTYLKGGSFTTGDLVRCTVIAADEYDLFAVTDAL